MLFERARLRESTDLGQIVRQILQDIKALHVRSLALLFSLSLPLL